MSSVHVSTLKYDNYSVTQLLTNRSTLLFYCMISYTAVWQMKASKFVIRRFLLSYKNVHATTSCKSLHFSLAYTTATYLYIAIKIRHSSLFSIALS